ncbi:hypothetical protein JYS44_00700, partial [Phycisphaeraceae bacterium AH-315-B13]|nr:hypothetical protein [Phycisphaeraceae bacterium AH-315-B13]
CDAEIEFKSQSCKDLVERFNSDRNGVVHHRKSYDSDFDLPDYTWQIHKICFEIAHCLAKQLALPMNVNRLLIT